MVQIYKLLLKMYFSYHCEVYYSQALTTVLSGDGQCFEWNCYFQSITVVKGELNLDNKWLSDDLFYIIMNEIHPRFNQF